MIFYLIFLFLFGLLSSVSAQPVCNLTFPNQLACQPQASSLLLTDILLGQQQTGPSQSNQTVKVPISQLFSGRFAATFTNISTPGNTVTLSGATIPVYQILATANFVGTSTRTDNTSLANVMITSSSDNASITNPGILSELLIAANYGGTSFKGGRAGVTVQQNLLTASTLGAATDGLFGGIFKVTANVNAGGTALNSTTFGLGSLFGFNPWCALKTGSTFYNQCVGQEIDATIQTGASSNSLSILQLILTSDHAVHGFNSDTGIALAAQTGASVGLRSLISVGSYNAQFPGDANGYILQVKNSQNAVAAAMGAGFDLNQLIVSGASCGSADTDGVIKCPEGAGFYWRNPGVQLLSSGAQIGYGSFGVDANGVGIDANYSNMATVAGSITVGAGGSQWTTGDKACDIYGDCVTVTATAGAVTAVSAVLSRGWQTSAPANPVAFTARSRSGAAYGTGLTLNLGSWTAKPTVDVGITSATAINVGNTNANIRIGGGSALATTATTGFPLLPTMAGAPTGAVGAAGQAAFIVDTTDKKMCWSIGSGTWSCVTTTP